MRVVVGRALAAEAEMKVVEAKLEVLLAEQRLSGAVASASKQKLHAYDVGEHGQGGGEKQPS